MNKEYRAISDKRVIAISGLFQALSRRSKSTEVHIAEACRTKARGRGYARDINKIAAIAGERSLGPICVNSTSETAYSLVYYAH